MPVSQTPTANWVEHTPGVKTYYTPPPATPATPPKTITDPSGYTGTGVPKWAVGSQYDTAPNAANNFNQAVPPKVEPPPQAPPPMMPPDDPYGVGSAYQGYIDSLKETDEVKKTRKQLDDIEASKQLGLVDTENRTIPMAFITGQQAAIEKRAGALQTPLNQRLAAAQQQAQQQQAATQAAYEYALKNREYAAAQAKANQPMTLSAGETVYDPVSGKVLYTAPKTAASGGGTGTGGGGAGVTFTDTQLAKGAAEANIPLRDFVKLNADIQNEFINGSTVKDTKTKIASAVTGGTASVTDLEGEVSNSALPDPIKDSIVRWMKTMYAAEYAKATAPKGPSTWSKIKAIF